MKLSDAEVRELFQRQTAREESRASECLGEDILIRAAARRLDDAERERVAAHIAHCSDCAREFRIVREMAPFESAARRELHHASPASWIAIAASVLLLLAVPALIWMSIARQRDAATIARLQREAAAVRNRPVIVPPTSTVDVEELRTTIAELSRPQTDVPIVDLDADVVRGSSDVATVTIPRSAGVVTLILHLPDETSGPVDVEILGKDGSVAATERVAARRGRGSIALTLHRKLLHVGTNAIRVRAQGRSSVFHFRVELP